ncbi:hypothetical protein M1D55_21145 [Cupriavidus sp. JZ107]
MKPASSSPGALRLARGLAIGPALAALLALGACAGGKSAAPSRQFDIDAFLRAPDTTLSEVLTNPDFLAATAASARDCATMLQSERSGVLEELPGAARGDAWLMRPTGQPDRVWLVTQRRGGERGCHGPLPADAVGALVSRAGG